MVKIHELCNGSFLSISKTVQKSLTIFKKIGSAVKNAASSAIGAVYPDACEICGRSLTECEDTICLECDINLPRANIHLNPDNRISQRLARLIPQCPVASWFIYESGEPQHELIHQIKYHNRPSLGEKLGQRFAKEIQGDGFFDDIDLILYVPMHWLKFARRGYNQSYMIARGVSRQTNIPIGRNLIATRSHSTQTAHTGLERSANVIDSVGVTHPEQIRSRHVLIVDDVITTGSTIEASVRAALTASPSAISVLSLGITRLH